MKPHTLAAVCLLIVPAVSAYATMGDADGTSMHPTDACSHPFHVSGANWDLCWQRDDLRVQGLEVNRVLFHDRSVAWKMGVPFSITQYDGPTAQSVSFKDVLGTPEEAGIPGAGNGSLQIDPGACPRFHDRGELRDEGRVCIEHEDGIEEAVSVWARYDVFNYRFLQGWTFHERGVIEPFVALGGELFDGSHAGAEGTNHFHHVYWRLDLDIAATGNDTLQGFAHVDEGRSARGHHERTDQLTGALEPFTSAGDAACQRPEATSTPVWCQIDNEGRFASTKATTTKWRIADEEDANANGHARSFEFRVRSDAAANSFSSFDVMALEHQADDAEIGHETSPTAVSGDTDLLTYMTPAEVIEDPVAWVVFHAYHDTRDEDRGSMTYHYVSFELRPANFLDENRGEQTFP